MKDKLREYLEGLFANVPPTAQVQEAKEELLTGMYDRYEDCIAEGMDPQEAYDAVVDSVGDLRELFDELDTTIETAKEKQQQEDGFDLNAFLGDVGNFASGLISGLFSGGSVANQRLVNTQVVPLAGIDGIDASFVGEKIYFFHADGDDVVIQEYMNQDDPELFATTHVEGTTLQVHSGRRQGVFGLRSYVEIYIPASFGGSLSLVTVRGGVVSNNQWKLSSLSARTVSGEVAVEGVEASLVRLSSTSGNVKVGRAAGSLDLHSISGSLRAEVTEGSGSFKTTSGSVRVMFGKITGHIEATSVSGGIRLGLPEDAAYELDAKTTSGTIHTGFDDRLTFQQRKSAHGFIGQAPYHHVRASSISGSIHIND